MSPMVVTSDPSNAAADGSVAVGATRETRGSNEGESWRHRKIATSDGSILNTYDRGAASAPALILVNAFGMPVRFWEPMARALAGRFHLVTWDSRGIPAVDTPFDPLRCGVLEHANDMREVMQAYGVTQALAVGWCSGCQIVLRYASFPDSMLSGAVLLNGTYCLPDEWVVSPYVKNLRAILPFCTRGTAQSNAYSKILMNTANEDPSTREAGAVSLAAVIPPAVADMTMGPFSSGVALYRYAHTQKRFMEEPTHGWTEAIDIPVLVVGGERDQIVRPDASREIARRLADAELIMHADGDHYSHYFDPSVASLIDEFHARRIVGAGTKQPTKSDRR